MSGTAIAQTRFLASVRSADEALVALEGGADIVDVKEPATGALGAAPLSVIAAIVRKVGRRSPVSATIGDLPLTEAVQSVVATAKTGVDYVKIGLFGETPASAFVDLQRCAASGIRLIAVMFADRGPKWELISILAEAGFTGVMLDTADKGQGGLRRHLTGNGLRHFLGEARAHGLVAGLAGSLRDEDARALLPLRPDILGFRGALCGRGLRGEALQLSRVKALRALIPQDAAASRATDRVMMADGG